MTKEKNESAEELFRAEGKVNIGIYHSGGQKHSLKRRMVFSNLKKFITYEMVK